MSRTTLCTLTLLTALPALLLACGRAEAPRGDGLEDDPAPAGIPGVYAMDARRTIGSTVKDPEGEEVHVSAEVLDRVQGGLLPEAFRLVLKEDNTFELTLSQPGGDFRTAGTWTEETRGVALSTTMVNGEPAEDAVRVTEHYAVEPGYLVVSQGEQRIYMKKQKPQR